VNAGQIPEWYRTWHASVDVHSVSYDVGGIDLVAPYDLQEAQCGYAVSDEGESFVGTAPGDWQPDWLVIGNETTCGDPIFLRTASPYPVFTAMHGEGDWNPEPVAPSLEAFRECLRLFNAFAQGRTCPVDLDANKPSEEEQNLFLERIKAINVGDADTSAFWRLAISLDEEE